MIYRNTWRYPKGHPDHDKLQHSKIWSYEFTVKGIRIRQSANTENRAMAKRIESEHRRELQMGIARLDDPRKPRTFADAAKVYLETGTAHWSPRNAQIEAYNIDKLMPHFGKKLLSSITGDDIGRFQAACKKLDLSPRT